MNIFRFFGAALPRGLFGFVVGLLLAMGGCAKAPMPEAVKAVSPSTPSPTDVALTEAGLMAALSWQWENSGNLPKHFSIHGAPFEVVAPGLNGAILSVHVWIRCEEDSFVQVRQVIGPSGRISTVVRKVYASGQFMEIPLRVEVTVGTAGVVSFAAPPALSIKEWGRRLGEFVHPVDVATSDGARLLAAPEEWVKAEEWLQEHRTMREDFDRMRQALATRPELLFWSPEELRSLVRCYSTASEAVGRDGQRLLSEGRPPTDLKMPPKLAQRIRDDDVRFQSDYAERERQSAAAVKILDGK